VWKEKTNGLIVDYIGVFRDLQRALAIYGTGAGGVAEEGETPVQAKAELVAYLRARIADAVGYCSNMGVRINDLIAASGFEYIALRDDAVELLIITPDTKTVGAVPLRFDFDALAVCGTAAALGWRWFAA
jgi:type I restriction enzyme R subunit